MVVTVWIGLDGGGSGEVCVGGRARREGQVLTRGAAVDPASLMT